MRLVSALFRPQARFCSSRHPQSTRLSSRSYWAILGTLYESVATSEGQTREQARAGERPRDSHLRNIPPGRHEHNTFNLNKADALVGTGSLT